MNRRIKPVAVESQRQPIAHTTGLRIGNILVIGIALCILGLAALYLWMVL